MKTRTSYFVFFSLLWNSRRPSTQGNSLKPPSPISLPPCLSTLLSSDFEPLWNYPRSHCLNMRLCIQLPFPRQFNNSIEIDLIIPTHLWSLTEISVLNQIHNKSGSWPVVNLFRLKLTTTLHTGVLPRQTVSMTCCRVARKHKLV